MSTADGAADRNAGTDVDLNVDTVLRISGLSKSFGGTWALRDVDLDVRAGEIHALLGPNGSGKSTLIKILSGYHHAEPGGRAWLDDQPIDLTALATARHDRLRFVHQDFGLVNELSALDNLALSRGFARTRWRTVDRREQARRTHAVIDRFGLDIDIHAPVGAATPVQRAVVAIAGALQGWLDGRGVLVLDEPTAVLPPNEVARLLDIVREVARDGAGVIYVSHRLDEIVEVADRVTVLREGRRVTTREVAGLTKHDLAALLVGAEVDTARPVRSGPASTAPVAVEVRGLCAGPVDGVDLAIAEGEVVGVAGLPGSGHDVLPYALCGGHAGPVRGSVRVPRLTADWMDLARAGRLGLPLVPADRVALGVIAEFSVRENFGLPLVSGARRRRREQALLGEWIDRVGIRAASPDAAITTLSGGNQQKVVMARSLAQDPPVLVLCEPTAGVDIGTRAQLYELVRDQAARGLAVLVSSTDTDDLLALCSRVLVLRDGRIGRELAGAAITERALVHAMAATEEGTVAG